MDVQNGTMFNRVHECTFVSRSFPEKLLTLHQRDFHQSWQVHGHVPVLSPIANRWLWSTVHYKPSTNMAVFMSLISPFELTFINRVEKSRRIKTVLRLRFTSSLYSFAFILCFFLHAICTRHHGFLIFSPTRTTPALCVCVLGPEPCSQRD